MCHPLPVCAAPRAAARGDSFWLQTPLLVCADPATVALGSSEFAAAVVEIRVRSTHSRFVLRSSEPDPASRKGSQQALAISVKWAGWTLGRGVAASARQLPPWPGSGSVLTTGGCGIKNPIPAESHTRDWGSAGRLGDLRTIRAATRPSALETRYACSSLLWGHGFRERSGSLPCCRRLPRRKRRLF